MNRVKEVSLPEESWMPGESLSEDPGYIHVVISYDIEGDRYKIDKLIDQAIENNAQRLRKIENVNTVLYWQNSFHGDSKESLLKDIRSQLTDILSEIFVNKNDLSNTNVDVFCLVGNVRAFSFKIKA